MFRRASVLATLLAYGSLASAATPRAEAGGAAPGGDLAPYSILSGAGVPEQRGLERRVLFFVHFNCPYCRAVHGTLRDWARTLPPDIDYEVIPAIGLAEHAMMGLAYYAVLAIAPQKLEAFEAQLYAELQDGARSPESAETFIAAAAAVGIPREQFSSAVRSASVRAYAARAQALTRAYGLTEVPSVVVGNRFVTQPRRVHNQSDLFVTVMNGLVSMLYGPREGGVTR
jgi:thiol:disulfide interchange protein DsbA